MRDRPDEHKSRSHEPNKGRSRSRRRPDPDYVRPALNSPELFNSCLEHAAIGFSITDLQGRVLEVNPALCSLTGYSEAELRSISNIHTLIHPSDLPDAIEKKQALIAGEA